MGIFEKRRMKTFIEWVGTFDVKDPATHKGKYEPALSTEGTVTDATEALISISAT